MPSIPGSPTSMSTKSGSKTEAASRQSSPDSTVPTTTNGSVNSTTAAAARRNGSWSSTISTRTGATSTSPPTPVFRLLRELSVVQAPVRKGASPPRSRRRSRAAWFPGAHASTDVHRESLDARAILTRPDLAVSGQPAEDVQQHGGLALVHPAGEQFTNLPGHH